VTIAPFATNGLQRRAQRDLQGHEQRRRKVTVTYSQGTAGSGSGTSVSVPSPWTVDTTVTGSSAVVTASGSFDASDGLTCEIIDKDTGKSVVKNSVPPSQGASVTCSTFSLGG